MVPNMPLKEVRRYVESVWDAMYIIGLRRIGMDLTDSVWAAEVVVVLPSESVLQPAYDE